MKTTLSGLSFSRLPLVTVLYAGLWDYVVLFVRTLFIWVNSSYLFTLPRLNRSPFADSYWFLYSTKTTYYTPRIL